MSDDSWGRKVKFKDFFKIFLFIGFIVFVVNVASEDQEENRAGNSQGQAVPQVVSQPEVEIPEVEIEVSPLEVDEPEYSYRMVKRESFSIPSAKRLQIRVMVYDSPVTEAGIKAISQKIVDENKGFDALSILFYDNIEDVEGAYTLAMADWAPNGKWGDANLKTGQILVYTFKDIVIKE